MSGLNGIWHNEHGSELRLDIDAAGRVAGRFRTGVGFGKDESFDIVGRAESDLVSFTVSFGKAGAITAWVGHFMAAEARIEALWQMAVALPHRGRPEELWKGIWSGADVFLRGPAETARPRPKRPPPMPLWLD